MPYLLPGGIIVILSAFTAICVINDFARHITPDISVYLLHARTFTQELNRFTASHDSKGILLTFILAPSVRLFGADMFAAAAVQLVAFAAAFFCLFLLVRSYAGTIPAVIISLLALCAIHSYQVWGANARPEDFGLALVLITLLAAIRGGRKFLAVAGAMMGLSFFLKTTLVIAPAAIIFLVLVFNAVGRAVAHDGKGFSAEALAFLLDVAWILMGLAFVSLLIFGWILLFDDIHEWYRQTISWPLDYRMLSIPFRQEIADGYLLITKVGLQPLFLAGCLGLVFGWIRGLRRETALLAAAMAIELYRVSIEGARWSYLLVILIPLLVVAASMLGTAAKRTARSTLVWLTPLLFLAPFVSNWPAAEWQAFQLRVIRHLPSPVETFAGLFQPYYRPGETILPVYNDCQIVLLMNAPRPEPILPLHYNSVSPAEQAEVRRRYEISPPDWIIKPVSNSENPLPGIIGAVNYSYYVQLPANDDPRSAYIADGDAATGQSLSPILPASVEYRVELDNGFLQAWHLVK